MLGRTLAHYQILGSLGSGGMGEVYRARDLHLERDVAIKVLPADLFADADARRRFRREALSLSRLQHPNIAVVHDFSEDRGTPYLVMELIEGETLQARLQRGPLPEPEVRRLGAQIASALAAAHESGVVHRDLKPGNIMLAARGDAKVLDFGLAKQLAAEEAGSTAGTLTVTDALVGTLPYMAPEQLLGRPADGRTDMFSLGAVLHEMATGVRPFRGETAMALGSAILHEGPVPIRSLVPTCSMSLEATILHCLEKRPEDRFGSAAEVVAALTSPSGAARGPSNASGRAGSAVRGGTTRRYALAAIAALALILALALARLGPGVLRHLGGSGAIRAMAVLPLSNLSHDPEQDYFADGMTDELIITLSQIAALKVISRTSSMSYRATNKSARQIARELGVDALITGSVQRSGNHVRVRAELVDASTDRSLWAEGFDRELT
ncbi:MAG: serine/threonine-protein kinase, partial [Candidatus Eisenbacteria bacterium]